MKTCKTCMRTKPEECFYENRTNGRMYSKSRCRACENEIRLRRPKAPPRAARTSEQKQMYNEQIRLDRQIRIWAYVLKDSKARDRHMGRENDLTAVFVKEQLRKPCTYCGEQELRMTLDRVDNSRGHLQDNVLPACIRCNSIRKDMPYAAWTLLAPSVCAVRIAGLFGDWTPGNKGGKRRS